MTLSIPSTVPSPILYLGWVIQPLWDGSFGVYPRTDTRKNVGQTLSSYGEAVEYIDDEVGLEAA